MLDRKVVGKHALVGSAFILSVWSAALPAQTCDHRETRIDSLATWECMTPLSPNVLYFVPGPKPGSEPPVPGPEALPCFDFVLYVQIVSNRLEHLANLTESGHECLEGITNESFREHQESDDWYKGVLVDLEDEGERLIGVVIHNDQTQYQGGDEFTPDEASYVIRNLRESFDESEIGRLVYFPIGLSKGAARDWLENPVIADSLDFDVHFPSNGTPREFVRGDANEDDQVGLADAIYLLKSLFGPVPAETPDCADALDVNDDGYLGTSDAIYLLYHLFIDSRRIAPPHDVEGFDRTPDDLPECGIPLGYHGS